MSIVSNYLALLSEMDRTNKQVNKNFRGVNSELRWLWRAVVVQTLLIMTLFFLVAGLILKLPS